MPNLDSFKLFYEVLIKSENSTAQLVAADYIRFLRNPSLLSQSQREAFEARINSLIASNFFNQTPSNNNLPQISGPDLAFVLKNIFTDHNIFENELIKEDQRKNDFLDILHELKQKQEGQSQKKKMRTQPKTSEQQEPIITLDPQDALGSQVISAVINAHTIAEQSTKFEIQSAIQYLINAGNYLKAKTDGVLYGSNMKVDLADVYFQLARCYFYLHEYSVANKYASDSIQYLNEHHDLKILLNSLDLKETLSQLKRHYHAHQIRGNALYYLYQFNEAMLDYEANETLINKGIGKISVNNVGINVLEYQALLALSLNSKYHCIASLITTLSAEKKFADIILLLKLVNKTLDDVADLTNDPLELAIIFRNRFIHAHLIYDLVSQVPREDKQTLLHLINAALKAYNIVCDANEYDKLTKDEINMIEKNMETLKNLKFSMEPANLSSFSQFGQSKNLADKKPASGVKPDQPISRRSPEK